MEGFAKGDVEKSTIGDIEIIDVKTSDLATTLQNAISEWQGEEIEIVSDGISKTIDPKQFVLIHQQLLLSTKC